MMRIVQIRRGTKQECDSYRIATGEQIYVTDNAELRIGAGKGAYISIKGKVVDWPDGDAAEIRETEDMRRVATIDNPHEKPDIASMPSGRIVANIADGSVYISNGSDLVMFSGEIKK